MPVLGPKMAPKLGSKISILSDGSLLGHPSGARWPQDGRKMAQEGVWRGFGGGLEGGLEGVCTPPSKDPPKTLQIFPRMGWSS